ncbi:DNA-3-methyladenine glycosylase family protein [Halorarius halobius]|uniref:DNA-3-methyladenine glycosylase family protein n=1 Tax=Halorarius halobius TaxID=2962671 RepID=UPI0020CDB1B5|nr:DNA-3-methyladenine glycosylase 2 family protein [Halorarius halobius]
MDDPHARLREDPELGPLVEEHGPIDLDPADEPFERLVVSVINQQLSTESAAAIRERVFEQCEVTPAGMLAADETVLREAGLSSQKTEYVRNLAREFEAGRLSRERLAAMSNDEAVAALTEVKGVGTWTAKMALVFVLAREDVFPVEDLGIRKAMAVLYGFEEDEREAMVEHAERWRPYRSYASRYLWRAVD